MSYKLMPNVDSRVDKYILLIVIFELFGIIFVAKKYLIFWKRRTVVDSGHG